MAELAGEEVEFLVDGARYGDLEDVCTALDEYRVSPDSTDDKGRTALHMASANGHAEIVRLLLERGANPEAENAERNTPLHWACLNGRDEVVRILMENGASASALNSSGRTPVDEALGRPFQDQILAVINAFGKATDHLDRSDDPEAGEVEDQDPVLKAYDKYGS